MNIFISPFMRAIMWPFFTALLWSNFFIIVAVILQRQKAIKVYTQFLLLFLISVFSIVRLFIPIEPPGTKVILSKSILNIALELIRIPLFSIGDFNINVCQVFLFIWGVGIIAYLGKMIQCNIRFKKYVMCEREPEDSNIHTLISGIISQTKIKAKVKVVQTPHVNTPMLTGFFKPVIQLPDIQFTDAELEYVLRHECNHYIHKDMWIKLLINIFCALFWWNPLVYILKRNMNHLIELKSDLTLAKQLSHESRTQYLEVLLKVVKNLSEKKSIKKHANVGVSFVSSAEGRNIKQRFQFVNYYKPMSMFQKFANLCVCVLMLLIFACSFSFVVQPSGGMPDGPVEEAGYTTNAETAYLIDNNDGSFSLYVYDVYMCEIDDDDKTKEPLSSLPVINAEK